MGRYGTVLKFILIMCHYLQASKALLAAFFMLVSCLAYSSSLGMIFNGLHGVISQKKGHFMTTGVTTSNPTSSLRF
jgi:hypothetical protein